MHSLLKKVFLYSTLIGSLTLGASTFAQPSDSPFKKSGYPTAEEREEAKSTFQKLSEFGKKFDYLRSAKKELSAKIGETDLGESHRKLKTEFNDLAKKLLAENGINVKPNEGIQVSYGFAGTDSGYWNSPSSIHLSTYSLKPRNNGTFAMNFENSMSYTFKKNNPNIEVFFVNEKLICEPRPSIKRIN